MTKGKAYQDSADQLALRQAEVLLTIHRGIQAGGLSDLEWAELMAMRRLADRGHISERTRRVLEIFRECRLYVWPHRLGDLIPHLERDFDQAMRLYTMKGLLQVAPDQSSVDSTLSDPMEGGRALRGDKDE